MSHKSAFISIVGRPNTGKSTLLNALVGEKIAITSRHPNTTRGAIRGIVTRDDYQLIFVDTPGFNKPKSVLGTALNVAIDESMIDVDIIIQCIPAMSEIGSGDRFVAKEISSHKNARKFAVVTMIDKVDKSKLADQLIATSALAKENGFEWDEIIPVSAKANDQVSLIVELAAKYAPEGPAFYPADMTSDQERDHVISELIREATISGLFEEVPHSIAIVIDDFSERESSEGKDSVTPFYDIHASVIVERDSQKAIIIGKGGEKLKEIGSRARAEIEKKLKARIYLNLRVKVMPHWQSDPKALRNLGLIQQ